MKYFVQGNAPPEKESRNVAQSNVQSTENYPISSVSSRSNRSVLSVAPTISSQSSGYASHNTPSGPFDSRRSSVSSPTEAGPLEHLSSQQPHVSAARSKMEQSVEKLQDLPLNTTPSIEREEKNGLDEVMKIDQDRKIMPLQKEGKHWKNLRIIGEGFEKDGYALVEKDFDKSSPTSDICR